MTDYHRSYQAKQIDDSGTDGVAPQPRCFGLLQKGLQLFLQRLQLLGGRLQLFFELH